MWAVALGSSSLPRAQQNGHVFIACAASASAWGNQGCCRCQGKDQGECVQTGASCFQLWLPLPGQFPADSRSCLSWAVSWFKGMLFPGEHAQTVVAFSNPERFVPCISKVCPCYLRPCYSSVVQPGSPSSSVLSAGFWLGVWCSHDGKWWWSLELWQLCSEHRIVIFSRRGCCLNIFWYISK